MNVQINTQSPDYFAGFAVHITLELFNTEGFGMDIFKTRAFVGEHADDLLIDTISHEGQWWLVASWLEHPATLERIPERIILMDGLHVRFQEANQSRFRFLLSNSLPTAVLDGKAQDGFVVAIQPAALLASRGPGSIH